jgi:hypothetical protein
VKRYCIKCRAGKIEFLDILSERDDGYIVKLTKIYDGNEKISEEFISRHLFDICSKTGYIFEMRQTAAIA